MGDEVTGLFLVPAVGLADVIAKLLTFLIHAHQVAMGDAKQGAHDLVYKARVLFQQCFECRWFQRIDDGIANRAQRCLAGGTIDECTCTGAFTFLHLVYDDILPFQFAEDGKLAIGEQKKGTIVFAFRHQ